MNALLGAIPLSIESRRTSCRHRLRPRGHENTWQARTLVEYAHSFVHRHARLLSDAEAGTLAHGMCGRYLLTASSDVLAKTFDVHGEAPTWQPRFNLAPTEDAPIVRLNRAGQRELVLARWGFVPHWSKGPGSGPLAINARAESIATNKTFRGALDRFRCVVPASGFYEWKAIGEQNQPFRIGTSDLGLLGFAGVWSRWRGKAQVVDSYAIITTKPTEEIAQLHDRMPVVLPFRDTETWLDPKQAPEFLMALLETPRITFQVVPVSPRVNRPGEEGPDLIQPIDLDQGSDHSQLYLL